MDALETMQHDFYGHGKLLLTGEYFVLDGAQALALPTRYGQRLQITYQAAENPCLTWESIDEQGQCWLKAHYELWHFNCLLNVFLATLRESVATAVKTPSLASKLIAVSAGRCSLTEAANAVWLTMVLKSLADNVN